MVLEHVNVNKDNMIEENEMKFDALVDSLFIQRKYARSRYFYVKMAGIFKEGSTERLSFVPTSVTPIYEERSELLNTIDSRIVAT